MEKSHVLQHIYTTQISLYKYSDNQGESDSDFKCLC